LPAILQPLQASVAAGQKEPPADGKAALNTFAAEAQKAQDALKQTTGRIEKLAKDYPAIETHQNWQLVSNNGVFQVRFDAGQMLQELGRSLHSVRQQLL